MVIDWFSEVRPATQPAKWIDGGKRLTLSDGSHVNHIDVDTFQVLDTNRIARRSTSGIFV
jgi:hypothetical protein